MTQMTELFPYPGACNDTTRGGADAPPDSGVSELAPPALSVPFAAARNPHTEEVQRRSAARWAERLGFAPGDAGARRLQATQLGRLVGLSYPNASIDDLDLIADYVTWIFLWDDLCEEGDAAGDARPAQVEACNRRLHRVLRGDLPRPADSPLIRGLAEILGRLRARMPGYWLHRFTYDTQMYLEACEWEATDTWAGVTPNLPTYLHMRRFTVGFQPMCDLIEMAGGGALPLQVRSHAQVRALINAAADVLGWSNDILSLPKELRAGARHNLVLVLREARGCSVQEAMREAVAMHDAQVQRFIELERALPSFGAAVDARLSELAAGMRAWMRANLDWSALTGRYRLVVDPSTDQRAASS